MGICNPHFEAETQNNLDYKPKNIKFGITNPEQLYGRRCLAMTGKETCNDGKLKTIIYG